MFWFTSRGTTPSAADVFANVEFERFLFFYKPGHVVDDSVGDWFISISSVEYSSTQNTFGFRSLLRPSEVK